MTSPVIELVRWQSLSESQRHGVLRLSIAQQQIEYAGTVERAIAGCEAAQAEDVAGLAILLNGTAVGFVVLSRGKKQPDWAPAGSVALTAMRIDSALQGKGIGSSALLAIDRWLSRHWPDSGVIALSVDDDNAAGRKAYQNAGYAEYTEPRPGRIGLVRYLSKPLTNMPDKE